MKRTLLFLFIFLCPLCAFAPTVVIGFVLFGRYIVEGEKMGRDFERINCL